MKLNQKNALDDVVEQEKIANDFGFCWQTIDQVLEQIRSECNEVKQAWDHQDIENLKEEIGDLINAALSLAVFCKLDPVQLMTENNTKFQKRFNKVVALAKADGLDNLHGQPLEVLLSYWDKAKKLT